MRLAMLSYFQFVELHSSPNDSWLHNQCCFFTGLVETHPGTQLLWRRTSTNRLGSIQRSAEGWTQQLTCWPRWLGHVHVGGAKRVRCWVSNVFGSLMSLGLDAKKRGSQPTKSYPWWLWTVSFLSCTVSLTWWLAWNLFKALKVSSLG